MKMMIVTMTLLVTGSAFAGSTLYKDTYSCFNRAQLADAPFVSLAQDEYLNQYVHLETRGSNSYVKLQPSEKIMIDGNILEGAGVEVMEPANIEEPGRQTTVELKGLDLTYVCNRL